MFTNHRADGSGVFHAPQLTRPPKLQPLGHLAFIEAAHGLDVEGTALSWGPLCRHI